METLDLEKFDSIEIGGTLCSGMLYVKSIDRTSKFVAVKTKDSSWVVYHAHAGFDYESDQAIIDGKEIIEDPNEFKWTIKATMEVLAMYNK